MAQIAVIGAGIIGLTTAVEIQEKFRSTISVTIFAENVSPNTTGDVSAGLWTPYLMKNTPEEKIIKWSKLTSSYFENLWKNGQAEKAGISLLPVIQLNCDENFTVPNWWKIPFGCQRLSESYLDQFRKEHKKPYSAGIFYITFTCEPIKFLPFIEEIFLNNGGVLIKRKICDFKELANDFNVVVNCSGLQAKELTGDDFVVPIRGQITRVEAPWQYHCIMTDHNYIIPNIHYVILGGTKQENDYNLDIDESDKNHILGGSYKLIPGLKQAPVFRHMVGLRPGRSSVRLELEKRVMNNKTVTIVHNYGHGGCGVTLCIGCAAEAAELVEIALNHRTISKL